MGGGSDAVSDDRLRLSWRRPGGLGRPPYSYGCGGYAVAAACAQSVRRVFRPCDDRNLPGARGLRLAGDDDARRTRSAQPVRQYSAGDSASDATAWATADGAAGRGPPRRARHDAPGSRGSVGALGGDRPMLAAFVYFILPAILLILGLPIFVVLILTAMTAILTIAHVPLQAIQTYMFGSLDNFPLLAVPFFVLAGEIMGRGGIANRVVTWVVSIIGGVRGSLAVTTVASSELFGAMAHTSVGTVVAIGRLLFPSLTKHGYSERFAVSLITSSGAVAVIIPPSISMILYAMTAQVSAIKLFTAGILPSLLIGVVDAVYVLVYARIKMVPLSSPARWKNIWASTREASWAIGTIVVIFGGIYGGMFTPTEAAGVAVVYSLFVTTVIYRELTLADIWRITLDAAFLISQILVIVAAAGVYSWLLTTSGIPQQIVAGIEALHMRPWETLLLINIGLLLAGSFLEPPAAILILTPLLLPIVIAAGVHPLHFGIIMAVNLSIGLYTPPFGLNLFAAHAIFEMPITPIYRGVLPFVLINFATLMVITYVPAISMVLVGHGP